MEALWDLVSGKTLKITVRDVTNQVYGVVLELREGGVFVDINNKLVELELAIRHQGILRCGTTCVHSVLGGMFRIY